MHGDVTEAPPSHSMSICQTWRRRPAWRSPASSRTPAASSPGDELMTCSTSEVAVCCCERFAQLIEQADVFNRDNGLAGKVIE